MDSLARFKKATVPSYFVAAYSIYDGFSAIAPAAVIKNVFDLPLFDRALVHSTASMFGDLELALRKLFRHVFTSLMILLSG